MKTYNEHILDFKKIHGEKYIYPDFQEIPNGIYTEITIICRNHGKFVQKIQYHKRGLGCPKCVSTNNRKKTLNIFKQDVYNKVKDEYSVIDDVYKNNKTNIKMKHNICGCEFHVRGDNFLKKNGTRCPSCFGSIKTTIDFFKVDVAKQVGDEYSVLKDVSIYKKSKFLIKHNVCGTEYVVSPYNFLKEQNRCHKCASKSKGEDKIFNFLKSANIKFKTEYKFKDCINYLTNKTLRFDFYLLDSNIIIEFDGRQHYIPESFGSNKTQKHKNQNFIDLTIKDDIKTNYCKEKNIKLIRIPYWELNNIENILKLELCNVI